jgi:acyl-CoA dehydrogenase family protein 9
VGASKWLLDRIIGHVKERRQFGLPLADFELVQEKIGWMVAHTFGLESMSYLTTGLVDAGVADYSLVSAMCKVSATEFMWYAANRAMQLKGGAGYMRDELFEKMLRDIRIFPIFEGANDVMRAFVALSGLKPVGEKLKELGDVNLRDSIGSLGVLADYVTGRIQRELRPDQVTEAHPELSSLASPIGDQVKRLRDVSESQLREHKGGIALKQFTQKRLCAAVSDIYGQIATLSRVTSIFEEQGVEPSGQERYIAETFCTRAARRVGDNLDAVESNDDERMTAIAKLAYKRGEYGYAFFDD